jgi:predicted anti-sigma-YlaC factor YlaD
MHERHPREIELARFGDRGDGEAVGAEADCSNPIEEHLRWCAHCRSVVADYDWLQEELAATLTVAAEIPAPRPQWWAVRERVCAGRRRQVAGWRISALSGVVLAVCMTFSAFPIQSATVAALTSSPEPMVAPAPITANVTLVATPTPTTEMPPPSTPAFMLPPTPPQSETEGL